MKRLGFLVLAACSSSPAPTPTPAEPAKPADAPPPAFVGALVAAQHPTEPYVGTTCNRIMGLQAEKCSTFGVTVHLGWPQCIDALGGDPAVLVPEKNELRPLADCAVTTTTCEAMVTCLEGVRDRLLKTFRSCGDPPNEHPVGIAPADYAERSGAHLSRYAEVRSSKAAPIERCGVPDANAWLASLSCADGSHPLLVAGDAHRTSLRAEHARVGNVGEGGRCRSVVDLYRVACPNEPDAEIYIDAYVCPK